MQVHQQLSPPEIKSSLAIRKYINHFREGESSSGPIFLLCFWFILILFCYFFTTPSIFSVSKRSITTPPQLLQTLLEPLSSITYSICCIRELRQDPPSPPLLPHFGMASLSVWIITSKRRKYSPIPQPQDLSLWCVQSFKRFCGNFSFFKFKCLLFSYFEIETVWGRVNMRMGDGQREAPPSARSPT